MLRQTILNRHNWYYVYCAAPSRGPRRSPARSADSKQTEFSDLRGQIWTQFTDCVGMHVGTQFCVPGFLGYRIFLKSRLTSQCRCLFAQYHSGGRRTERTTDALVAGASDEAFLFRPLSGTELPLAPATSLVSCRSCSTALIRSSRCSTSRRRSATSVARCASCSCVASSRVVCCSESSRILVRLPSATPSF